MPEHENLDSFSNFDIVAPEPGALIESLRAFGYTPQDAIADLIDNSITAGAKNIWIHFSWKGPDSYITIRDDGKGMAPDKLISAMRAGSQNPLTTRDLKDLGRFGLGLKTASFSQCRILTVASKTAGSTVATRRWDLDYVGKVSQWRLLHGTQPGSEQYISTLENQVCGTLILWEHIDRLVNNTRVNDQKAEIRFYDIADKVKEHLGMVFHRFISGFPKLNIYMNNHKIDAWDPFMTNEDTTQKLPEEPLQLNGNIIKVQPFILPHASKLSSKAHEQGAGPKGWNAQQGFYIYRNRRLLVAGDWLGLGFQKEEHFKLARIRVDLSNSMDIAWDIDVRKSRARPPGILFDDLKRIARISRTRAVEVYRHRGKILARQTSEKDIFVWNQILKDKHVSFRVNRNQPLITDLFRLSPEYHSKLEALLRIIEETIPVALLVPEISDQQERSLLPFEDSPPSEILQIIKQIYHTFREQGISDEQSKARLISLEPFQNFKELIMSLKDE